MVFLSIHLHLKRNVLKKKLCIQYNNLFLQLQDAYAKLTNCQVKVTFSQFEGEELPVKYDYKGRYRNIHYVVVHDGVSPKPKLFSARKGAVIRVDVMCLDI